jgi:tetratricopeptide (TPR) repeat protein
MPSFIETHLGNKLVMGILSLSIASLALPSYLLPSLGQNQTATPNKPAQAWETLQDQGIKALNDEDLDLAEKLMTEAVKEAQKFGVTSEAMGVTLTNLGLVYSQRFKNDLAKDCFEKAIKAKEATFGPMDESLIRTLKPYARTLKELGKTKEVQAIQERISKIEDNQVKVLQNKGDYSALLHLSVTSVREGQSDKAEKYATSAYETSKKADKDAQIFCLNTLSQLQLTNKHYDQALTNFKTLIQFYKETPKHSSFDEGNTYLGLSSLCLEQGNMVAGKQALGIAKAIIDKDKPADKQQERNHQLLLSRYYANQSTICLKEGRIGESKNLDKLSQQAFEKSQK